MTSRHGLVGLVGVGSLVFAVSGLAQPGSDDSDDHRSHAESSVSSAQAGDAYREAAMAMQHDMASANTGNPDIDFASGMLAHHQGAVAMAKVELEYGQDPEMRALAKDIIAAQQSEIAQMEAWLKANASSAD